MSCQKLIKKKKRKKKEKEKERTSLPNTTLSSSFVPFSSGGGYNSKLLEPPKTTAKRKLLRSPRRVPVKRDLDGVARLSLDDPRAAQGVLVEARPAGGQDGSAGRRQVPPARRWGQGKRHDLGGEHCRSCGTTGRAPPCQALLSCRATAFTRYCFSRVKNNQNQMK